MAGHELVGHHRLRLRLRLRLRVWLWFWLWLWFRWRRGRFDGDHHLLAQRLAEQGWLNRRIFDDAGDRHRVGSRSQFGISHSQQPWDALIRNGWFEG